MNHTELEQQQHWEKVFTEESDLYGTEPSVPAQNATEVFKKENVIRILELGGGQGRDTLYFAQQGFSVNVVDYAFSGINSIREQANALGLSAQVSATLHDVRMPLPFEDLFFDACYSHMLYCMALTMTELLSLSNEVRRVLKPGGYQIYTVRNTDDPHYGTGIHRGEGIYEIDGFTVHFFSRETVVQLARGFEIININEFQESELPRKLFQVTLRKTSC
jgi:SAM-dependent methyltransferase